MAEDLSQSFRDANVRRCIAVWRKIEDWTTLEWAQHMRDEVDELCEALEHNEDRGAVMKEVADVYTYLDLLCERLHVNPLDMWEHVIKKFNEVSERVGYRGHLELTPDGIWVKLVDRPDTKRDWDMVEYGAHGVINDLSARLNALPESERARMLKILSDYQEEIDKARR